MKKLFTILTVVFATLSVGQAQFSGGLGYGMFNNTESNSKLLHGFNLHVDYSLDESTRVGLNYGRFSHTETESFDGEEYSSTFYISPITVTYQRDFMPGQLKPYWGGELGFYSIGYSVTGAGSESESYIGLAPVVGAKYSINEKLNFNGSLKFHYVSTDNQSTTATGLHLGLTYSF